jgi:pyrroloquinoline quinone biosynthesis protein B
MTSIMILGSGQDAGIPHTGCRCEVCDKAKCSAEFRRLGPSIAVFDEAGDYCYIIDISPDFKTQLETVCQKVDKGKKREEKPISAVLLTHAHFGHVSGLWQLGKEAMNEKGRPVFCTPAMARFLKGNDPFRLLVKENNIDVIEIERGKDIGLKGIKCTPIEVPHRNEITDTIGFAIESKKKVVYIPDLDHWTEELLDEVRESDVAIIDGTFFSRDEIDRFDEVRHPPIKETIKLLGSPRGSVYFTHVNHTNPVNENGEEREFVEGKGFGICKDGQVIDI